MVQEKIIDVVLISFRDDMVDLAVIVQAIFVGNILMVSQNVEIEH